jgi:hypothetical protein
MTTISTERVDASIMIPSFAKLKELLSELFQLDHATLDLGIQYYE